MYFVQFEKNGQVLMLLGVTHPATLTENCGLKGTDLNQWLWEKGNEIISNESNYIGKRIIIGASDISNGAIIPAFENLRKEKI